MTSPPSHDVGQVIDEAAQWLSRMNAGDMTDSEQAAWTAWRGRSAEHQRVWECATRLQRRLAEVPPDIGRAVLDTTSPLRTQRGRRRMACGLAGLTALAWLAAGAPRGSFFSGQRYETARGERRDVVLADGSRLILNTATAVRVSYTAGERLIHLQWGEVSITTARDTAPAHREFRVLAEAGQLRALGTRFLVRTQGAALMLSVHEGVVEARPAHRLADPAIVRAGMQLRLTRGAASHLVPIPRESDAWTRGALIAEGMPLGAFLQELSRYRTGYLSCDPAVADRPVWGVFQLGDIDTILMLVSTALGLQVHTRTPYWTTLVPAR